MALPQRQRQAIRDVYEERGWGDSQSDSLQFIKELEEANVFTLEDQKIPAIKVLRRHTGMGLKEAKEAVERMIESSRPISSQILRREAQALWRRSARLFRVARQLEEGGSLDEVLERIDPRKLDDYGPSHSSWRAEPDHPIHSD